jgi:hypothetical protein
MLRYAHAFFNQVAQSAACNHFHSLQPRCCRWLLMTHDRMQSDEFLLTQEFPGYDAGGAADRSFGCGGRAATGASSSINVATSRSSITAA